MSLVGKNTGAVNIIPVHSGDAVTSISMECRLFVWSIILEPLLFFVISDSLYTGAHMTLARIVQMICLLIFICKFVGGRQAILLPNLANKYYLFFGLYFCLLIISSFFGVIFYGSYELKHVDRYENLFRDHVFRIFLEFIILLYYFFYFVVIPRYILKSKAKILYLLNCIERMFYVFLILGFVDLFFSYLGFCLIPRHLVDSRWVSCGVRFHGFAGEPRDAFPYLIFGFLVIHIKARLLNQKVPWLLLPMVVLALLLSQSASGVVGVVLGAGIFVLFNLNLINFSASRLKAIFAAFLALGIAVYSVGQTARLREYYFAFLHINDLLLSGAELPYLVSVQSNNIFPLWVTFQKILNFDLLPVLFGSGMGSSAILNNNLGDFGGAVANPHAQITRTIFESGFVGLWAYILFFYTPFKILLNRLPKINRQFFYAMFFMLLGTSLGHRSTTIFVFTGIVISISHIWFQRRHVSPLLRECATRNETSHR